MEDRKLLDSEKGLLSDSTEKNNINLLGGGLFNTFSGSSSYSTSSAYTSLSQSASVPIQAYGAATTPSASGRQSNVIMSEFDPFPVDVICQDCQQAIVTTVKYRAGKVIFMACGLLGLLTCGLSCCSVPLCLSHLKDAYHFCPECGNTLGVYRGK